MFSRFTRNFKNENNFDNSLELNLQEVSNDKYLKLYKIDSNLVNYDTETLENSFKFTQERENLFFGLNMSVYETLKNNYELYSLFVDLNFQVSHHKTNFYLE